MCTNAGYVVENKIKLKEYKYSSIQAGTQRYRGPSQATVLASTGPQLPLPFSLTVDAGPKRQQIDAWLSLWSLAPLFHH